jgi:hypothetical protein
MNIIYGVLCLLVSFLMYKLYVNWRKFKKRTYNNDKLEVWDYRLFITYWGIIIISVVASIIFFLRALIE